MKVKVLYLLDSNDSPYPKMWAFHSDVNPDKVFNRFKKEAEERGVLWVAFLVGDEEDEDGIRERLIDGFDVQGENLYFKLETIEVMG